MSNQSKFCFSCGSPLESPSKFCINCGVQLETGPISSDTYTTPTENQALQTSEQAPLPINTNLPISNLVTPDKCKLGPGVAALLSFLCTGLGQMINGQLIKGLVFFGGGVLIFLITGGIAVPVVWIMASVDAYLCAKKLKNGQSIGKFSFF